MSQTLRFVSIMILLSAGIGANAQESTPWYQKVQIGGDIRMRHDYVSKASSADKTAIHQERIRLRLAIQAPVNEKIKAKVRFSSASGGNPISANSTLTDNASRKPLWIDLATIDWALTDSTNLLLGKFDNPMRVISQSQLVYDSDYNPEGLALTQKFSFPMFMNLASYVIDERAPNNEPTKESSEPDSYLLGAMLGSKVDFESGFGFTIAGGYHHIAALEHNGAVGGGFMGNSNDGSDYLHDYHVAELVGELRFKTAQCLTSFYVDAIQNVYIAENNLGSTVGALMQTLGENGKPVWTFGYAYRDIDSDATLSAMNDSDFAQGIDGHYGHIFTVGYTVAENTTLALNYGKFNTADDDGRFDTDRGLLDLQVNF